MTIKKRIKASLTANSLGQAITMGSQIVLTPLYLHSWGVEQYGEWLILSSIPAYLAVADLGIGAAAGNEMTMRAAANDKIGTQKTFRAALIISIVAFAVVLFIGLIASRLTLEIEALSGWKTRQSDISVILVAFTFLIGLGIISNMLAAGYRCCGENALGINVLNISRLFESISVGFLLLFDQSAVNICLTMVFIKFLTIIFQFLIIRVICKWLFIPKVNPDKSLIGRLYKPALSFLVFPLTNAISTQGPIIIFGSIFGSAAVAIFTTMRTLARIPLQITTTFNSSISPEISRAFGSNDLSLITSLHRKTWFITTLLLILSSVGLIIFGPLITEAWLGKDIIYNPFVFNILVMTTMISATWNASAIFLTATNNHMRLGVIMLSLSFAALIAQYFLAKNSGLSEALLPALFIELMLLFWVLPKVIHETKDSLRGFGKYMIKKVARFNG